MQWQDQLDQLLLHASLGGKGKRMGEGKRGKGRMVVGEGRVVGEGKPVVSIKLTYSNSGNEIFFFLVPGNSKQIVININN